MYFLIYFMIPGLSGFYSYALLGEGNFTIELLSTCDLIKGFVYCTVFLIVLKLKWKRGWFSYMFMLGQSIGCLGFMMCAFYYFIDYFTKGQLFFLRVFVTMVNDLGYDLMYIPLFGRISKNLPEGLESTSMSIFLSLIYTSATASGFIGAKELAVNDVKSGYYQRAMKPFLWNTIFYVGLVTVGPVFLFWKE